VVINAAIAAAAAAAANKATNSISIFITIAITIIVGRGNIGKQSSSVCSSVVVLKLPGLQRQHFLLLLLLQHQFVFLAFHWYFVSEGVSW